MAVPTVKINPSKMCALIIDGPIKEKYGFLVGTLARFVIESTFAPPIDGPIKEKNGFLVETSPRFVRAAPNWRPKRRITSSKFETPSTLSYSNKMESKNNWTTFGLCSAESLRGIKHFQGLKKADGICGF